MKVGKQDQQITLRVCSKHLNEKVVDFLTLTFHMGTCKQVDIINLPQYQSSTSLVGIQCCLRFQSGPNPNPRPRQNRRRRALSDDFEFYKNMSDEDVELFNEYQEQSMG